MRMRPAEPTKWDSFTVSAQVLLIWVVTPPPSFFLSFLAYLHKHPPSPLSTPLMPKEACACMPTGTLKPTIPSPNWLHTHTHSQSCFWVPTEVWQKPLDRWHTHLMLSGQGQRFSLLSDERLSLALFIYATGGKGREWQRESKCLCLSLPYITQGERVGVGWGGELKKKAEPPACRMHRLHVKFMATETPDSNAFWTQKSERFSWVSTKVAEPARAHGWIEALLSYLKKCVGSQIDVALLSAVSIDYTSGDNEITNWMCPLVNNLLKHTKHKLALLRLNLINLWDR